MADERVTEVAQRAADMLPEPPAAHDAFGYLAWEELVLSTARRLQWLMELPPHNGPTGTPLDLALAPLAGHLDGTALLTLAALLWHAADTGSCEALLARSVARSRGQVATPCAKTADRTFGPGVLTPRR